MNEIQKIINDICKLITEDPDISLANLAGMTEKTLQNEGHKYYINYGLVKRILQNAKKETT